ncbi:hypothetical protein JCM8547_004121 [Rhodosporidiobolus lusitaniae]
MSMTFNKLPEETWDQVCEEVGKFEDMDAVQTLLNLCRICKAVSPPTQHELYRAPFRIPRLIESKPGLQRLLSTLESSPQLASHTTLLLWPTFAVKDTSAVALSAHSQASLIALCPNLQHGTVYLRVIKPARKMGQDLAKKTRLSHVQVVLDGGIPPPNVEVVIPAFVEPFSSSATTSALQLVLTTQ